MIRLSEKTYKELTKFAKAEDRSISNAGEWILKQFLEMQKAPPIIKKGQFPKNLKKAPARR